MVERIYTNPCLNHRFNPAVYQRQNINALWQMVREGDDSYAFEVLFNRLYQQLCSRVRNIIQCDQQAEEIVADVFTKIWTNRRELHIQSSLKSYLNTAVHNQTIDYLRKQIKRRKISGELVRDAEAEGYHSPEEKIIGRETHYRIQKAVNALPPQGQYIFKLSRDEGLKYREIADKLGLSIKTVETHMRRSLIFLRSELGVKA